MTEDAKQLDRNTLYEEVWSTPMQHLAKQYGLSDQGLRKVCVRLQIPLPIRGHWAKIAAGQTIAKPPLLPLGDRKPQQKRKTVKADAPQVIDPQVVNEALQRIKWPKGLHPTLLKLCQHIDEQLDQARKLKAKHDKPVAPRSRSTPNWDGLYGSWQGVLDDGYLQKFTHKSFVIRVSFLRYERTMLLLDAICKAAEKVGFIPCLEVSCERLELRQVGTKALLRVSEQFAQHHRSGINWSGKLDQIKYRTPTGCLRVHVGDSVYSEKIITDDTQTVEQKLDLILKAVVASHQQTLQWRAETEKRERDRQDAEKARQELAEKIRQEKQRQKQEEEKREALLSEVKRWKQAQSIRLYVAALDERLEANGVEPSVDYPSWRQWALETAQSLEGLDRRLYPKPPEEQTLEASIRRLAEAGIRIPT